LQLIQRINYNYFEQLIPLFLLRTRRLLSPLKRKCREKNYDLILKFTEIWRGNFLTRISDIRIIFNYSDSTDCGLAENQLFISIFDREPGENLLKKNCFQGAKIENLRRGLPKFKLSANVLYQVSRNFWLKPNWAWSKNSFPSVSQLNKPQLLKFYWNLNAITNCAAQYCLNSEISWKFIVLLTIWRAN
jgi:hypothetical protein